jgi:hypothetical protein
MTVKLYSVFMVNEVKLVDRKRYQGLQGGYEILFTTRKRAQYNYVIVISYTHAYYKIAPIHKRKAYAFFGKKKN